jgi:mono/diheme cytochrome c family protein
MHRLRRRVAGERLKAALLAALTLACAPGTPSPAAGPVAPAVEPGPPPTEARAPGATPPDSGSPRDNLSVTEAEYQGWKYFAVYCERCHAPDAVGTADAPDLRYSVSPDGGVTADSFRVIVKDGSENGEMKGFEDLIDDQRIEQMYAYITARSEGPLAAGRPHRASGRQ